MDEPNPTRVGSVKITDKVFDWCPMWSDGGGPDVVYENEIAMRGAPETRPDHPRPSWNEQ